MNNLNEITSDVTKHILKFKNFLNKCWGELDKLMENHDWENDGEFLDEWVQVNWEFLVERELLKLHGYLSPLACNAHITPYKGKFFYKLICEVDKNIELKDWIQKTFNYEDEELLLSGFRAEYDATFGLYPPFDYIEACTIDRRKIYIVPITACRFFLKWSSP